MFLNYYDSLNMLGWKPGIDHRYWNNFEIFKKNRSF